MNDGIIWGEVTERHDNIIIVGSGSSLKGFNFNKLRGLGHIITINDSAKHVNDADSWFTLDPWGLAGPQLPPQKNIKLYAAVPQDYGRYDARSKDHRRPIPLHIASRITFLHRIISSNKASVNSEHQYTLKLCEDKRCISTGNSGYGALNLAYHMEPKNILILGIDGTIGYFYESKKTNRPLNFLNTLFKSTVDQLQKNNIKVINGSKESIVTPFPRYTPDESVEVFKDAIR